MTLEAIGAGLGRTGTNSLKLAPERRLEAPCYHISTCTSIPSTSRSSFGLDATP
jgi:Sulfotransferase domain